MLVIAPPTKVNDNHAHGKQEIEVHIFLVRSRWPSASILGAWCFYLRGAQLAITAAFMPSQKLNYTPESTVLLCYCWAPKKFMCW